MYEIEINLHFPDFQEKQVMPRVNGKSFRCDCGGNVFTEYQPYKYRCNSCNDTYSGEPVIGTKDKSVIINATFSL